jgi:SAM-dependent methyltransferase
VDSVDRDQVRVFQAAFDPWTTKTLERIGVGPEWRCLLVGAEAGSIAEWLGRRVGEDGHVVVSGIEAVLPTDAFDLIHVRGVLDRDGDPDRLLHELVESLAPEGVLVVENVARYPIAAAHDATYRRAMKAWADTTAAGGTDYRWTARLPAPLVGAGLTHCDTSLQAPLVRGASALARFWSRALERVRPAVLDAGFATAADFDKALALLADPDFWDLAPAFVSAWGRRRATRKPTARFDSYGASQ